MKRMIRSKKGVTTVVSSVLMIAIVYAVSIVAILWSTGMINDAVNAWNNEYPKIREHVTIEEANLNSTSSQAKIYIRNTGRVAFTISAVYIVNSTCTQTNTTQFSLDVGQLYIWNGTGISLQRDVVYTLKVVTAAGTWNEKTFVAKAN
jgi:archaellum component FlaF (FlaF/FlaG flagellin family)